MQRREPSERAYEPPWWLLTWAVIGAPVAWAVHLGARYPLVPLACGQESELILHAVTAASASGILLAGAASWRLFEKARGSSSVEAESIRCQRLRYLAAFGMGMSLLFLLVVGSELLPTFFVDPCAGVELGSESGT